MMKKRFNFLTQLVMISFTMLLSLFTTPAMSTTIEFFDNSAFLSSTGNLILIDFDSLTPGNDVLSGNEFASQGLNLVQRDSLGINVFGSSDNSWFPSTNFNSQSYGIASACGVGGGCNGNLTDNFDFIFSNPVFEAGLWIGNIFPGTTEVQFLASDGSVIASEIFNNTHTGIISGGASAWDNRIFYGITTDIMVDRIRTVEPGGDSDVVVYDDIQFSATQIPEPATIFLLGLGFLGFLVSRKFQNIKINRVKPLKFNC